MFLQSRGELARLQAIDRELSDRYDRAVYRRRSDDVRLITERRRRVRHLIALHQEFNVPNDNGETVTIRDLLERFS